MKNTNVNSILYGYIDKTGEFAIEPKFNYAGSFKQGKAIVKQNNKYGIINKKGEYIIPPIYDEMKSPTEQAVWVKTNGLWGLLGFSGGFLMKPRYDFDSIKDYSEDLAAVIIYGKVGFVDTLGNMVIRPGFVDVKNGFSEGFAAVRLHRDYKWEFTNRSHNTYYGEYEDANDFSEGLANVLFDSKWGYLDRDFWFQIDPTYQYANKFSQGLACVKLNDKYGFIDYSGDFVIGPQFEYAASFINGFASISIDDKEGFINKIGEIVVNPKFDLVHCFHKELAVVNGDYWTLMEIL